MKRLITFSLIGSSFLLGAREIKADWDKWGMIYDSSGINVYTFNSSNGEATLRNTYCLIGSGSGGPTCQSAGRSFINEKNGNYVLEVEADSKHYLVEYDLNSDTFTKTETVDTFGTYQQINSRLQLIGSSDGTISNAEGTKIIQKKSDGSVHIGPNSAVFKEENGREKFWAQDANGKSIPIDITNGSKLLINGRDVEQSINNVGALSAALTGLPTVPTETTLACGLGTGTHGGDFAFSGGCASKVNEKLSINYAASMTMPGQDYAGDFDDTFSARAGFVWKLGKATQPNLISMKKNQKLINEITDLKSENKKLNKKITKFETEKSELLARLERLEKIALSETNSRDLATIKLP